MLVCDTQSKHVVGVSAARNRHCHGATLTAYALLRGCSERYGTPLKWSAGTGRSQDCAGCPARVMPHSPRRLPHQHSFPQQPARVIPVGSALPVAPSSHPRKTRGDDGGRFGGCGGRGPLRWEQGCPLLVSRGCHYLLQQELGVPLEFNFR
jgi:hypothetical protein